jgi:hypothetical protein
MSHTDYDTDFYTWTQTQAAARRAKDVAVLNLDNPRRGDREPGQG